MALTRAVLKGMGLAEEQVNVIIDEHVSTLDGLKSDRDKFKAESERIPDLEKEIEELKSKISSMDTDDWQGKYEKEHAEYEQYKIKVAEDQRISQCKVLYRNLLKENGVGESHIDSIIKVTDFSNIKIDKSGNLVDADKHSENIKSEWAGFITSKSAQGAGVEDPPENGDKMTKESFGKLSLAEQMKYANMHPDEISNLL